MSDQKVTSSLLFPKDCHLAQQEKFALSPWDGMRLQETEIPRRKEQLQFGKLHAYLPFQ